MPMPNPAPIAHEWMPSQIFEGGRPYTPPTAPTRPANSHQQAGSAAPPSPEHVNEPDSPGRQRKKRKAAAGTQAGPDATRGGTAPPVNADAGPAPGGSPPQSNSDTPPQPQRQAAADHTPAAQQIHPWILEGLQKCGLERVRGVDEKSKSTSEVRLPERLRQPGSKLVGRWFVRSKVHPQQPPAPKPKDFQMKATLDQDGYERMLAFATEYGLLQRKGIGAGPGSACRHAACRRHLPYLLC